MRTIQFDYRDFWDIPRAILVEWNGVTLYLLSRFDEASDEYESAYTIFRLPERLRSYQQRQSWIGLEEDGVMLGSIPVSRLRFDRSLRKRLELPAILGFFDVRHE